MPTAWRLTKARYLATAWDGEGAKRAGGRWNSVGTAVVYAYDGAETTGDVVATGGTGGSTEKGVYTRAVDLSGVNRYFRFSVHQDLNATGTDTNQLMAVVVFAPAGVVTPND